MNKSQDFSHIRLDGGDLSLNFVNTVHDRFEEPFQEYLLNYPDLVNWTHFADGLNQFQKGYLLQLSHKNQKEADQIFNKAIRLREAIYRHIVCLINQDKVPAADTQLINQWLSKAFSNLELTQVKYDFILDWKSADVGLERVMWPIIRSFTDLITSDMRSRIKQCSNCGWVFVDNSKNGRRRWCSMETCGNRVKARRHAQKTRS